jgi:acyl-CoA dehydrogenase family member 9
MSVAKNLLAGRIVEDNLFPYPRLREKDREVLGMMLEAIDEFLASRREDFQR